MKLVHVVVLVYSGSQILKALPELKNYRVYFQQVAVPELINYRVYFQQAVVPALKNYRVYFQHVVVPAIKNYRVYFQQVTVPILLTSSCAKIKELSCIFPTS